LKISDTQLKNLMNLLLTLPFGSPSEEVEESDETDGAKPLKAVPRNIATIESSKMMADALNFVKESVAKIGETSEPKEEKEESDGQKTVIAFKSIVFDFKLNQILVTLFEGNERSDKSAVATAQLIRFEIYGELLTDTSIWATCLIGDLSLNDVRTSRSESGIKTLLEKELVLTNIVFMNQFFLIIFLICLVCKSLRRVVLNRRTLCLCCSLFRNLMKGLFT
jgi:hypothetical protein